MMGDWVPELYLKFNNERTQASIDLVNRIQIDWQPELMVDIGCGPGNSSQMLRTRWKKSIFLGIDNSKSMILKARQDYPKADWLVADASKFSCENKFDIVFSNAVIQWIPDHHDLLLHFVSLLTSRGVLAFQIPLFRDIPLGQIIEKIGASNTWKEKTGHCASLLTLNNFNFYYSLLNPFFKRLELWETHYIHIMDSHQAIIEWSRSTGLKPYLESLDNIQEQQTFISEVLERITKSYPLQSNGKVLFPFKRLFVIGYLS